MSFYFMSFHFSEYNIANLRVLDKKKRRASCPRRQPWFSLTVRDGGRCFKNPPQDAAKQEGEAGEAQHVSMSRGSEEKSGASVSDLMLCGWKWCQRHLQRPSCRISRTAELCLPGRTPSCGFTQNIPVKYRKLAACSSRGSEALIQKKPSSSQSKCEP